MKNLDLNGLGVQEMNATEMRATDGGWLLPFVLGGIVWDTLNDLGGSYDSFKKGLLAK